ncbi:MAG: DHH family phosphoesterase [archaeon]|nr:DHH family phosphoesterase [archaeon]
MLSSLLPLFNKKILLLTHAGADVDAFASAAAISLSLRGAAKTTIGVPEHMNLNAKALAKKLEVSYKINPSFKGYDAIVCLDFNKSKMLGSSQAQFLEFSGEKFLVDHHSHESEVMAPQKNSYCSKEAISTTELVYSLLKKTRGLKIPKKAYQCIAAGIITDSSSFLIADHRTFRIMSQVMEAANVPYSELVSLFSLERNFSEKIAALKAAKRVRIYKCSDAILASSEVGAFEADCASALVRLGANASFCGYAENGKVRISGRANNRWLAKTRFDLARDVFNRLEKYFPGEGGGHPGASGFNGTGTGVDAHLAKCIELTREFISKKEKNAVFKEYT